MGAIEGRKAGVSFPWKNPCFFWGVKQKSQFNSGNVSGLKIELTFTIDLWWRRQVQARPPQQLSCPCEKAHDISWSHWGFFSLAIFHCSVQKTLYFWMLNNQGRFSRPFKTDGNSFKCKCPKVYWHSEMCFNCTKLNKSYKCIIKGAFRTNNNKMPTTLWWFPFSQH